MNRADLADRIEFLEVLVELLRPSEQEMYDDYYYDSYIASLDDWSEPFDECEPCPVCNRRECYGDCVQIETRPKARRR